MRGEEIAIKTARLGSEEVNAHPEFEDCLKVAQRKGVPVKSVCQEALQEYLRKDRGRKKE